MTINNVCFVATARANFETYKPHESAYAIRTSDVAGESCERVQLVEHACKICGNVYVLEVSS